jgi:hypothetical protein
MSDYDEKEELTKEVYAHFGLAYYYSECLHRGLCIIFSLLGFKKNTPITKPRLEEKLKQAFSLTLGQISEKIKEFIPKALEDEMKNAIDKRNYLAHHFWFEKVHLLLSVEGLREADAELIELSNLFESLDHKLTDLFKPMFESFGINDMVLKKASEEVISGKPWKPLPDKRYPKKQERIVKAWNIPGPNKTYAIILQSEDGLLWQFCDIGLGWSDYDSVQSYWLIDERIQRYLPASINPRPSVSKPWNYEFTLANKIVLWVTVDELTKQLRYGLKSFK